MTRTSRLLAGVGAIAFGALTFVGFLTANWPGGPYSAATVSAYVAPGNLPSALIGTVVGLLAVVGLIGLFAYFYQAAAAACPPGSLAPHVVWGLGLAGAAAYAVGWGLVSAQPLAHAEAGIELAAPPTLTYLISEATSSIIFGSAPMLVGFGLIALALSSSKALPGPMRWATLAAGVVALASLAFFPFFLLLLWSIGIGVWLLVTGGRPDAPAEAR